MRNVLFIAYNYPPAGGVGVQRSLKFTKYLPDVGWQPIVLTTTPEYFPIKDSTTWKDVPRDTLILRVKSYDIRGTTDTFVKLKLQKLQALLKLLLKLPDPVLLWPYLARKTVREVIRSYRPEIVYTSSGPLSAHFLGLWVKQSFDLPWIADFRDRWWTEEWPPERAFPGYQAVNRRMQERVLRNANRVITVSQPLADEFKQISGRSDSFVRVIENGYDETEIIKLPPPETKKFTITYTGTLNPKRPVDTFIEAIRYLKKNKLISLNQIRVVFAGRGLDSHIPDEPPFEKIGFLQSDDLAQLRQTTNLFLLLRHKSPKNKGLFSGKIFEYLASNRPVLAISHPDNVAAKLVQKACAGHVVEHDPRKIAEAVLIYYRAWNNTDFSFSPDWSVIQAYTRRNLTRRLGDEFDQVIVEHQPK